MSKKMLPLNLQFFAEGDTEPTPPTPPAPQPPAPQPTPPAPIDYDRISQILEGKQAATEESVLKGYFRQQGLSKEEVEQAIASFKEQKAASQPNVTELQNVAEAAQRTAVEERIRSEALMMSAELGIELKNMVHVLRLANLKDVSDKDGRVNTEKLKEAINKVLEEIPVFKTVSPGSEKMPQYVRGTNGTYKPNQVSDEKAYLDQKYKNNPYYKGAK